MNRGPCVTASSCSAFGHDEAPGQQALEVLDGLGLGQLNQECPDMPSVPVTGGIGNDPAHAASWVGHVCGVTWKERADVAQRDHKRMPRCDRKGIMNGDGHGVAVDDPCQG